MTWIQFSLRKEGIIVKSVFGVVVQVKTAERGEGGGISACFKWQSFHFLLSDKQYASKTFYKTYTSIIC